MLVDQKYFCQNISTKAYFECRQMYLFDEVTVRQTGSVYGLSYDEVYCVNNGLVIGMKGDDSHKTSKILFSIKISSNTCKFMHLLKIASKLK